MADNQRTRKRTASTQTSTQRENNGTSKNTVEQKTSTMKRSNGSASRTQSQASAAAKPTQSQREQIVSSNKKKVQPKMTKTKKQALTNGKKKPGKLRVGLRSLMIVLMVAYAIVVGIIAWWGFDNFFAFYFAEKSPVMGANTESSRVKNTPEISNADIEEGKKAIEAHDGSFEKITIRQVGPTIHFYFEVSYDTDVTKARSMAYEAVITFADTIQNDMFGTYEAQIIVSKPDLPAPDEATLLRPAGEDGEAQQFPQYGVSNKNTNGANKDIVWARNGE